ncbi:MAG: hypothetical protein HON04_04010 [Planctomicrobium sp.]|jgi:neutral ceramidase|nr:hypothetical protein [Planctomicrobium sp.]
MNRTVLACLLSCFLVGTLNAQDKVFRAGSATSNITPPLGELIVGGWKPIPATHIHDELHARCLILDDGETKIGFVICDNVGIPREVFDAARQLIDEETDLDVSKLLMAATHTHSATTARGDNKAAVMETLTGYQQTLARRIADGVRRALNELQPAQIAWGSADEPTELFNRRWFVTDPKMLTNPFGGVDEVRMNPSRGSKALVRPAGPVDPEVSFISVRTVEGQPIALLANYSLHYVGGVNSGDVSADYFGYFASMISDRLNTDSQHPPFVGILTNGTSGDVNNINFAGSSPRVAKYQKMQMVAEKVTNRVMEAHSTLEWQDWVKLDSATTDLVLNVRQPTEEMLQHFEELEKRPKEERHIREETYSARIQKIQEGPSEVVVPLQVMRIGTLAIQAIPFEVFTEIGLELKDRSPFEDSFTIELANGSYGYLPTPAQHKLGGYETWLGTCYVQLDGSEKIVEQLLYLSNKLFGEE